MIAFRILFVIAETSFTLYLNESIATNIFNYFLLFIAFIFVTGIYNGIKELAYLATLGGFISLF